MPLQSHVSPQEPREDQFRPVRNDFFVKPHGGFWTSSWVDNTSGWIEWCKSEMPHWLGDSKIWLLQPKTGLRVYTVDCLADLEQVFGEYPYSHPKIQEVNAMCRSYLRYIDFEAMSQHYDAMHLTEEGQ